jgi:predicted double-glycine peptidase
MTPEHSSRASTSSPRARRLGARSFPHLARESLLLGALVSALFTSCTSERLKPELVSPQAVMLDLPVLHQDELYECGLVSITALCQYYKIEIPPKERADLIQTAHDAHGLSGEDLRAALERLGLEVFIFPGTLDHEATGLYHHADDGRPLLVMRSKRGGSNHYCLLLGYDEPLGNVFLLDPALGRITIPANAFAEEWGRVDRFTLLAIPRSPGDPNAAVTAAASAASH